MIFTIQKLRAFLGKYFFHLGLAYSESEIQLARGYYVDKGSGERKYHSFYIRKTDFKLSNDEIADIFINRMTSFIQATVEYQFRLLLEEGFGMRINDLVNLNSSSSTISFTWTNLSMVINFSTHNQITAKVQFANIKKLKAKLIPSIEKLKMSPILFSPKKREHPSFDIFNLMENIVNEFLEEQQEIKDVVYIPAGRAGLIEGFYSVESAFFALAPTGFIKGISIPPMPPTASEYYNMLLKLTGQKNGMTKICSEISSNLLNGEIILEKEEKQYGIFKIVYRFSKKQERGSIDVIHAGSMVKEIAGLYLAIQEFVKPGTYLIIEEPESHLHPGAQRKISQILMETSCK